MKSRLLTLIGKSIVPPGYHDEGPHGTSSHHFPGPWKKFDLRYHNYLKDHTTIAFLLQYQYGSVKRIRK